MHIRVDGAEYINAPGFVKSDLLVLGIPLVEAEIEWFPRSLALNTGRLA